MKKIFLIIFSLNFCFSQNFNDENLYRLAQALEQNFEIQKSYEIYETLWKNNKSNYSFFDGVVRTSKNLKNYKRGIESSIEWLKFNQHDVATESNLSGLFFLNDEPKKADSVWNLLINKNNNEEFNYRIIVNTQVEYRLYEKAIETYKLGRRNLKNPNLFSLELGAFYSSLLMYKEATIEYLNFLKEQNQQFDFIISRISQLIKTPEGIKIVKEVIVNESKNNSVLFLKLKQWIEIESKDYIAARVTTIQLNNLSSTKGIEIYNFGEKLFELKEFIFSNEVFLQLYNQTNNKNNLPEVEFAIAKSFEEIFNQNIYSESFGSSFKYFNENNLTNNKGKLDSSILFYEKVIEQNPISELAVKSVIKICELKEKFYNDIDFSEQKLDSLNKHLTINSVFTIVNLKLAETKIKQNKFREAENIFKKLNLGTNAEEKNKVNLKYAELMFYEFKYDLVAEILNSITTNYAIDETNDALLILNLINENNPNSKIPLNHYSEATLFIKKNQKIDAIKKLDLIINSYKTVPIIEEAFYLKGKLLVETGNFKEAIGVFKSLIKNYSHSKFKDESRFYIAEVNDYFIKNIPEAIKNYEDVIAINQNSIYAEKSRKRIRFLRNENL